MNLHGRNHREKLSRIDELLEDQYENLQRWAIVLARGDKEKADEVVQDFCLYLSLTKPNLADVKNLDGYLYISLRNLYQSSLARYTREAMKLLSPADFDTACIAVSAGQGRDTLERQNELRRICNYAVWRKDHSKSFSYFILHFFHGYFRNEVAELAHVPLSTIYNKLRNARLEAKAYLNEDSRVLPIGRKPPIPRLLWHKTSEVDFFNELRVLILEARNTPCLPESELLAFYFDSQKPITCELLSHLVSCEVCLAIIDRYLDRPTLKDRDPLDSTEKRESESTQEPSELQSTSRAKLRSRLKKRLRNVYEHHPEILSIAINGHITVLHSVQGAHSTLTARIESPEKARFVEVFSEQDVRLAMLPVGDAPPRGCSVVTQQVELSNGRWLRLSLEFDGLGLNSEVVYYDPVLSMAISDQDDEEVSDKATVDETMSQQVAASGPKKLSQRICESLFSLRRRCLSSLALFPAFSWALLLGITIFTGFYFAFRHQDSGLDAQWVISRSIQLEDSALKGNTEHQVLQIAEISSTGHIVQQGTVSIIKDGDGQRYVRELYDRKHNMLAMQWKINGLAHESYSGSMPQRFLGIPWSQGLSVRAFSEISRSTPLVQRTHNGYLLVIDKPRKVYSRMVEAILVLNHKFVPTEETLSFHGPDGPYEIRFLETSHSFTPSNQVPDARFLPRIQQHHLSRLVPGMSWPPSSIDATQLAELEVGVLYQLSEMNADVGKPVEVISSGGRSVQVIGFIGGKDERKELIHRLHALKNHRFLRIEVGSENNDAVQNAKSFDSHASVLNFYQGGTEGALAMPLLQAYFRRQGLNGIRLNSAVTSFSGQALQLSQKTLQNAYAINRLAQILSLAPAASLKITTLRQWIEMVNKHAELLQMDMQSLNDQLSIILPQNQRHSNIPEEHDNIIGAEQFVSTAAYVLQQTQRVNHNLELAFASNSTGGNQKAASALLQSTIELLPIRDCISLEQLAHHLSISLEDVNR